MENQYENLDSSNENEQLDSSTEEVVEENPEVLKAKVAELEKVNKDLHGRATRAEQNLKKLAPTPKKEESEAPKPSENKEEYSLEDTIAIINDKVTEKEDIETVKKFAKLEGISIADALKSPIVKTILSTKAEERKTAQATNTGVSRKATSKVSGEDLLEKFNQGEVPEKDEDLKKIIEQRWTPKEK